MKLRNSASYLFATRRVLRRWKSSLVAGLCLALIQGVASAQTAAPKVSCESLAKLALPDTAITMAQVVEAGKFVVPEEKHAPMPGSQPSGSPAGQPGEAGGQMGGTADSHAPISGGTGFRPPVVRTDDLGAFCRVTATLKPTSDSNIRIEVWLPLSGWNGKFIGVGGGGFAGNIMYVSKYDGATGLVEVVKRGYAAATTDSGHDNSLPDEVDGKFALGHPEKVIDYGYRAVHLMSVEGKEITKAFYGSAPKHAYFFGASRGGYEAITEANRYPEDYDGIGAFWPPNPFVLFNAMQLWANWHVAHNPAMFIPKEKYTMIHDAVLNQCDELDGVKDGVLENPLACHFDPSTLLCKGGDTANCLTAPQVELLKKTYQGPVNPRTGESIFPGAAPGEELGEMYGFATGQPRPVASNMFKYFVFKDASWDWETLNWDSDIEKALKETGPSLVTPPNFNGFVGRDGKLMIVIGWVNYHNPKQLIDFYNDAVKNAGADKTVNTLKLLTIPGEFKETHFDKVAVMEQWVEQGKAPDQITGSYYDKSKLLRTRPLCAYPKVAQYKGTGDTDQAENFVCVESKPAGKR